MTIDMDNHCKDDVLLWEEHATGRAYTWEYGTFKVLEARTSTERIEGTHTKKRVFKIQYADSENYASVSVEDHRTQVSAGIIDPADPATVSHLGAQPQ